jgi:hypothetical protein
VNEVEKVTNSVIVAVRLPKFECDGEILGEKVTLVVYVSCVYWVRVGLSRIVLDSVPVSVWISVCVELPPKCALLLEV